MKAYCTFSKPSSHTAVRFSMYPAVDETPGYILAEIATNRAESSDFDWSRTAFARLHACDVSSLIEVLRGMVESVSIDTTPGGEHVKFAHELYPYPGYELAISLFSSQYFDDDRNGSYRFGTDEAFMLLLALEHTMMYLCFGVPGAN